MRPSPARLLPQLGGSGGAIRSNGAPLARRFIAAGRSSSQGARPGVASNLAAAAASHPHPQRQQQPPQRQQQPPQQYRPSLLRPRPGAAAAPFSTLTHVDAGSGQPAMVHVGDKAVTKREAKARCRVVLPPSAMSALLQVEEQGRKEVLGKKGPVFATAIVAGVMGAKRTSELVPFCHPLSLDNCQVELRFDGPARPNEVVVDCTVRVQGRTGVEMEAMTGASVAALCVYDMCKAASHDIVIKDLQLLAKSGGKKGTIARAETISSPTNHTTPARSLSAAATPQPPQEQQEQPAAGAAAAKKEASAAAAASAAAIERGKRLVMTSTYKGLNGGHPPSSFSSYSRPPPSQQQQANAQQHHHRGGSESGLPAWWEDSAAAPPSAAEARVGGKGRMRVEAAAAVGRQRAEGKVEAPVVDYCI